MTRAPQLSALARQVAGDPETALVQVLLLLCEQLGMRRAVLGRISGGIHTISLAVEVGAGRTPELEVAQPASESWCAQVPAQAPLVVRDSADRPDLAALPVTTALSIRCYVGTVVRGVDGREIGVLGVAGEAPHTTLSDRDLAVLEGLSEVIGELFPALLREAVPAPRRAPDLGTVAAVVSEARDLESLTRPLLEALHDMSGLASTYLTAVHEDAGEQEILFAQNVKDGFAVPEGLHVPWADTLCKRSLDEGRQCTTDVPAVWGDSQAAQDLGIVTYVSVPVRLSDGTVWGTLCGADDVEHGDAGTHLTTLSLFATLIAAEVERAASRPAPVRTDPLTGCAHAEQLTPWLEGALADRWAAEVVAVVHLDVDDAARLAATLGTAVVDTVLVEVGHRLRAAVGADQLVARLRGASFAVAARVPRGAEEDLLVRVRRAGRVRLDGHDLEVRSATGLATSDGRLDPAALLAAAETAMLRDKPLG